MDVAATVINAAVVTTVGLILGWLGKGRFEAIDRRFEAVEERFERRMDALQSSVDGMRSDLTQIALALGVRRRASNG